MPRAVPKPELRPSMSEISTKTPATKVAELRLGVDELHFDREPSGDFQNISRRLRVSAYANPQPASSRGVRVHVRLLEGVHRFSRSRESSQRRSAVSRLWSTRLGPVASELVQEEKKNAASAPTSQP